MPYSHTIASFCRRSLPLGEEKISLKFSIFSVELKEFILVDVGFP